MTPRYFARKLLFSAFALLWCVTTCGCVTTGATTGAPAAHGPAPDVHGEPLALMPQGAIAWARADVATLRASPHYDAGMALARDLGADFALVERELGFDPFRQSERLAVAIYAPPGETADAGWPVIYTRGRVDREAILAAARARNAGAQSPPDATEHGVTYTVVGNRAYVFPASDVMLVMERALVRRVTARMSGESRDVLGDERFSALWADVGGVAGPFVAAVDLRAMRAHAHLDTRSPEAESLDALVVRGEAPGAVTLHAAGTARNNAAAQAIVRTIDEARREAAGQIPVRLLGLSRVLEQGVHTSLDGNTVRADVEATEAEARRLLRASALLREITGQ